MMTTKSKQSRRLRAALARWARRVRWATRRSGGRVEMWSRWGEQLDQHAHLALPSTSSTSVCVARLIGEGEEVPEEAPRPGPTCRHATTTSSPCSREQERTGHRKSDQPGHNLPQPSPAQWPSKTHWVGLGQERRTL